ncbi:MAG: c-type cytochrome [Xanthobacteraceae bacterium]
MIRIVLAAATVAIGVTAAVAQSDAIKARQALMKSNSAQNRIATEMLEGKRAFDLAAAKKVFATFTDVGTKALALFPEGSQGDSAALPAVWKNKADFDARLKKFAADAKAAGDATKDLASFKAQSKAVRAQCGACHKMYRKKKS